jgi:hypothetical protein
LIQCNVVRQGGAKFKNMGWDAHSSAEKDWKKKRLVDKGMRKAFNNADKFVKSKTGTVDWYLHMAGLDCSSCAEMLQKATGRDCWGEDWKSEKIEKINESANWDFEYSTDEAWAYWSAKKFLELCAKFKLSVEFSW